MFFFISGSTMSATIKFNIIMANENSHSEVPGKPEILSKTLWLVVPKPKQA